MVEFGHKGLHCRHPLSWSIRLSSVDQKDDEDAVASNISKKMGNYGQSKRGGTVAVEKGMRWVDGPDPG